MFNFVQLSRTLQGLNLLYSQEPAITMRVPSGRIRMYSCEGGPVVLLISSQVLEIWCIGRVPLPASTVRASSKMRYNLVF